MLQEAERVEEEAETLQEAADGRNERLLQTISEG